MTARRTESGAREALAAVRDRLGMTDAVVAEILNAFPTPSRHPGEDSPDERLAWFLAWAEAHGRQDTSPVSDDKGAVQRAEEFANWAWPRWVVEAGMVLDSLACGEDDQTAAASAPAGD